MRKINKELNNRPEVKVKHSGENAPNYGKFGKDNPNWKGDNAKYGTIHTRVRNKKIKPELCEICGLPEYYENLGFLELSNIRNHQYTDDPNDYQYVHRSCHKKYDKENRNKNIKS